MLSMLSKNWWVFLLRGLIAVAFGVIALLQPGIALSALILLFAVYAIADGIGHLLLLFSVTRVSPWWVHLLSGLLSLAAGIIALAWPSLTAGALLILVASWAIVTGVLAIIAAIRFRSVLENEWLYILNGALSVGLGVLFIAMPGAGILSLVWLLGLWALLVGILLIVFAFRLRSRRTD